MKVALVLVFLVVGQAIAAPSHVAIEKMSLTRPPRVSTDLKLCGVCVQFMGESINELLNIILNAGVVGTCGELCSLLADKTGSQLVGTVCELLCDFEGIKEFINLIEKADLDPIYYCELVKICEIKDDGDAKITSLTVTPMSVPYESQFVIELQFQTTNGTGTGEILLNIDTVDKMPLGQSSLNPPLDPGAYSAKWTVDASPDPDCDPSQQPCEMWLAGNYTVTTEVCNGECGSKHPHSQVYDKANAVFSVIKN